MKRIGGLLFAVLLALVVAQSASAQAYRSTQYNFQANFPGDVKQINPSAGSALVQFVTFSANHQFAAVVQYVPLAQNEQPAGTPDDAWWTAFEHGVANGGKDSSLVLSGCSRGNFASNGQAYPADFCFVAMHTSKANLTGRYTFIYRNGTIYSAMAMYTLPGSYSDADANAFVQSFGFLN